MGKINVLSFAVANLIAAGEVVDRPASVIKELMENSIDAGATAVTVEIQRGGIAFMRVSDNGCGIDPEDLPTALRRHATSKIKDAEDLDSIISLGFRGEALAAISSVANVRIISKTRDRELGAMIESSGGNVLGITERGASNGTTVIVEDLFFNVPARRKFLKKDITESMAVTAAVEKMALSHPEISIKFIADGTLKLETSGDGNILNTVYSVFGRDFAGKMLKVEPIEGDIKVWGYIGRSDAVRANRNQQNFFINGRYVKSKTAMAAIEQAYSSYIPPEKFPCCVLFIETDPRTVDVNVHPSKLEVKFSNEKPVFESIYYSVRNTLEKNITRPEATLKSGHISAAEYRNMETGKISADRRTAGAYGKQSKPSPLSAFVPIEDKSMPKPEQTTVSQAWSIPKSNAQALKAENEEQKKPAYEKTYEPAFSLPKVRPVESFTEKDTSDKDIREKSTDTYAKITEGIYSEEPRKQTQSLSDISVSETAQGKLLTQADIVREDIREMKESGESSRRELFPGEIKPPRAQSKSAEKEESEQAPYRIIGEAFNSYIFVETDGKLLLVDKHAAHERIIFETFKKIMQGGENLSQMLMLPIDIHLGRDECSTLREYKAEIESVGFTYTISETKISVHAIPVGISMDAVPEIFEIFAERLMSGTGNVSLTRDLIFEKALYQASCKAAIKAGRQYNEKDNEWLCEKLMRMPDITFCPHGRPVAIEMSKTMLDKQFERL